MTPQELEELINNSTEKKGETPEESKIIEFLETQEEEKINVFDPEPEELEEPETSEEEEEEEEEGEDAIQYGLGTSLRVIHESVLPPAVKFLLDTFTSKTLDIKATKLNAAQKKELEKAYEVVAQSMASNESPLFNATISILAITSGQILTALKDKEQPAPPTKTAQTITAGRKVETRGRKKKATGGKKNEN